MLTRSVFWATLAVMYLVLAAITYRGRQEVNKVQFPFASQMEHYFIPTPVASALKSIFVVEILGFILAAAAALYEAVTYVAPTVHSLMLDEGPTRAPGSSRGARPSR